MNIIRKSLLIINYAIFDLINVIDAFGTSMLYVCVSSDVVPSSANMIVAQIMYTKRETFELGSYSIIRIIVGLGHCCGNGRCRNCLPHNNIIVLYTNYCIVL